MSVIIEPQNLGDLVKYEEDCLAYSRDTGTVAAGQTLALGTVVGQDSTTGKLLAFDPAAGNGAQNPVGVLIDAIDATLIDRPAVYIARHAVLAAPALAWPSGITAPQKAAAIAALKTLGILVREGV